MNYELELTIVIVGIPTDGKVQSITGYIVELPYVVASGKNEKELEENLVKRLKKVFALNKKCRKDTSPDQIGIKKLKLEVIGFEKEEEK